jgi:hypothetical protein
MSASLLPPFSPSALSPSCLLVLYFTPSTEREKRERERERVVLKNKMVLFRNEQKTAVWNLCVVR